MAWRTADRHWAGLGHRDEEDKNGDGENAVGRCIEENAQRSWPVATVKIF